MSLTPRDLATTGKAPAGKAFPGDKDLEGRRSGRRSGQVLFVANLKSAAARGQAALCVGGGHCCA